MMKKMISGLVAVAAIVGLLALGRRMSEEMRKHSEQMAAHCKQMAAHCKQLAAQAEERREPVGTI